MSSFVTLLVLATSVDLTGVSLAADDYPCSFFTDCWKGGYCPAYSVPLCLESRVCILRTGDIIPLIINVTSPGKL
nr:hypothetical protein [Tanacetum cinerariifolium]